jgi:hypothetical protein
MIAAMDHHYVPQVYLRQWCEAGRLLRYRRVGPQARLECTAQAPKSIAFEVDLYRVPDGGVANSFRGHELEGMLASDVDAKLAGIVAASRVVSGRVESADLTRDIAWLMRTFVGRSPATLARLTGGAEAFIERQRMVIEAMLSRAETPAMRSELQSFLDPRRPRTTALAALAAVVARELPADLRWLEGDLYVASASVCAPYLQALGAGEFVTFDDPVVEWETDKSDLLASFTASPDVLVLIVAPGRPWTAEDSVAAVIRHTLLVAPHRQSLLCRTKASGKLLDAAAHLRPTAASGRAG